MPSITSPHCSSFAVDAQELTARTNARILPDLNAITPNSTKYVPQTSQTDHQSQAVGIRSSDTTAVLCHNGLDVSAPGKLDPYPPR